MYNIMARGEILVSYCHGQPCFNIIMTLQVRFQRLGTKWAIWELFLPCVQCFGNLGRHVHRVSQCFCNLRRHFQCVRDIRQSLQARPG